MCDIELYRALPGLSEPWTVAGVDVDMAGHRVVVRVDAGPGPRYDSRPRRGRHLDILEFTTWIEADVPRVECAIHGIKRLPVPLNDPRSQFTAVAAGLDLHPHDTR